MDSPGHRLFTVTKAGIDGLSHRQSRGRAFAIPSRGVRVRTDVEPWPEQSVDAALAGAVPGAIVVGAWAARLWGLPVAPWLSGPDQPVDLAVRPEQAHSRRRGVRGRRWDLPDDHLCVLDGRPLTTAARTWLDCAGLMPLAHVVAMGDAGLRRGLFDDADLRRLLHWGYGRRGVAVARRAHPLLDARSESPGESLIRVGLMRNGVPRPVCNYHVVESGQWLARVDLAWPQARIAVEYDGIVHLDEQARRRDARRRNLLAEHGWLVITATADDLARPHIIAAQVRAALRERTPPR